MNNKRSTAALDLGAFIRKKRLDKGISVRELAERLGIVFTFLSDIELGKRNPPDSVLDKMARHLDVSVDEFLGLNPSIAIRYFDQELLESPDIGPLIVKLIHAVRDGTVSVSSLQAMLPGPAQNSSKHSRPPNSETHSRIRAGRHPNSKKAKSKRAASVD